MQGFQNWTTLDTTPLVRATLMSRECSSLITYASGWDRWRNVADVALSMISVVQEGLSESVVNNLYSAVITFSSVFGDLNLRNSDLLEDVRKYAKKLSSKKHLERDPLLYKDLTKIYHNTDWNDLISCRNTVLCVVSWHSFLRYSDMSIFNI